MLLKSLFPLMLSHGQVGKETPHIMIESTYLRSVKPFIYPKFCRFVIECIKLHFIIASFLFSKNKRNDYLARQATLPLHTVRKEK